MIKINLSTQKSKSAVSFAGLDFRKLKIKAVLLAVVLLYVPDFVIYPMWEQERQTRQEELTQMQSKLRSLQAKVTQSKIYEKQIEELKAQEESLGQKLEAVKQAISEKKNPSPLLLYIAKNVPADLWINDLQIANDVMTVKGEALQYSSVGEFVNNMRSSIFIRDANIVSSNSTVRDADKRRIESFEVKFQISRFE